MPARCSSQRAHGVAAAIDDILVSTAQKVAPEIRFVTRSDLDSILGLERMKDAAGCSNTLCMTEIAGALGVDSIISVNLSMLGSQYLLTLAWIDTKRGTAISRHTEKLGSNVENIDLGVRQAVLALLRPQHDSLSHPAPPTVAAPVLPCAAAQQCLDSGVEKERVLASAEGVRSARLDYEKACAGKVYAGCQAAGSLLERGPFGTRDYPSAQTFFSAGCEQGDLESCAALSDMVFLGHGTPVDLKRALILARSCCDKRSGRGCNVLARIYRFGHILGKDDVKASALVRQACELNFGPGCTRAGVECLGRQDYSCAHALLQKACDLGHGLGCANLAHLETNSDKALSLNRLACDSMQPSCVRLAQMYRLGEGVEKDPKKALNILVEGCKKGDAMSCEQSGIYYSEGLGAEANHSKAHAIFQNACEVEKLAHSCARLAALYRAGLGGAKDFKLARTYFSSACDDDDAESCVLLGTMFQMGEGGAADPARAAQIFQKSCASGQGMGCTAFGMAFFRGEGVPKDEDRAIALFKEGCLRGDPNGCTLRLSPAP